MVTRYSAKPLDLPRIKKGGDLYEDLERWKDSLDELYQSLVNTSVATTLHNDLGSIQGGAATDYYHLKAVEHTELTNWLDSVVLNTNGSVDLGSGNLVTTGDVTCDDVFCDDIGANGSPIGDIFCNEITADNDVNCLNVVATGNVTCVDLIPSGDAYVDFGKKIYFEEKAASPGNVFSIYTATSELKVERSGGSGSWTLSFNGWDTVDFRSNNPNVYAATIITDTFRTGYVHDQAAAYGYVRLIGDTNKFDFHVVGNASGVMRPAITLVDSEGYGVDLGYYQSAQSPDRMSIMPDGQYWQYSAAGRGAVAGVSNVFFYESCADGITPVTRFYGHPTSLDPKYYEIGVTSIIRVFDVGGSAVEAVKIDTDSNIIYIDTNVDVYVAKKLYAKELTVGDKSSAGPAKINFEHSGLTGVYLQLDASIARITCSNLFGVPDIDCTNSVNAPYFNEDQTQDLNVFGGGKTILDSADGKKLIVNRRGATETDYIQIYIDATEQAIINCSPASLKINHELIATSFTIGANELTTSEWANLDGIDQTVATTSSPTFADLSLTDQSSCLVWRSGQQSITTGTITKVEFNTAIYDNDSEFDLTTDYDFTITTAGIYLVHAHLTLGYLGTGNILRAHIYVNGSEVSRTFVVPARNGVITGDITKVMKLAVNDAVTIHVYHNEGSTQDIHGAIEANTHLCIHKLA